MKKISWAALIAISGVLVIAQLVTIQPTNPAPKGDFPAPPQITALLRRACYDCHSNETQWPWYTSIAPISWLVERDVERGRKELNFSEWESYYPATRRRKLQWIERTLRQEMMPPWTYRLLHPSARLTEQELAALGQWVETEMVSQTTTNSTNKENSK
ncbi:MAG TPA: heme-binding domain-containing protein [Candidatus Acidoferrales bacterium]|nr:heme-binding domain-containing protein [Candidatus Acidoferrales bacterium]